MMLTTVGRGGDGQKIRDEILNIMHRNNIPEKKGLWMEVRGGAVRLWEAEWRAWPAVPWAWCVSVCAMIGVRACGPLVVGMAGPQLRGFATEACMVGECARVRERSCCLVCAYNSGALQRVQKRATRGCSTV